MKYSRFLIAFALIFLFTFTFVPAWVHSDPLVPPYVVKWSQLPDMNEGIDYLSMHRSYGPVVVDDFQSDGRPIYGFHWWGSYIANDPNLPSGQSQSISFEISFHPNVPAGQDVYTFSTPGQPYQFQIVYAQEILFGTTQAGQKVYEYWALLNTPWQETAGNIYWVDFAWNAAQDSTGTTSWGLHESTQHFGDYAVTTNQSLAGANPHLGPWILVGDGRRDMAFEVLTVPEPATLFLLGSGLIGFFAFRRRMRKS